MYFKACSYSQATCLNITLILEIFKIQKMKILKIHKNLSGISYQCYFTAFGGLYSRGCPLNVANEDSSRLESHLKHDSNSLIPPS